MDFLTPYVNVARHHSDGSATLTISTEQGSHFAKHVAGDFNPIHNEDAKRYCVPGDLLFAIALLRYSLSASMEFTFLEMLGGNTEIVCPAETAEHTNPALLDSNGKPLIAISAQGPRQKNTDVITALIRSYVRFSGQNFPAILGPLMQQHGVMINTQRPLVIYESMGFELDDIHYSDITLALDNSTLDINGKRGTATLFFSLLSNGKLIGQGRKKLLLSGLREYDEAAIRILRDSYLASRDSYQNPNSD